MNAPLIEYARRGWRLDHIRVFDAHAHIDNMFSLDAQPMDEHLREMDRLGIDVMAVSSVLAIDGEFERGNDHVADLVRRRPDRFVGYCHVSANYPELMLPELERCFATPGFKGVKVYQVGPRYDDPAFDPVWAFAAAHGAPVLAHTWGGNLTGLDAAAGRHPDVAFIPAHSGSGFKYAAYIDAALRCPNIYLDLTYSREHTNMIEHIVAQVGADRVVWGTDVPCFSMSHQLSKVLFARISDEDKRKILYETAAGLFGLE